MSYYSGRSDYGSSYKPNYDSGRSNFKSSYDSSSSWQGSSYSSHSSVGSSLASSSYRPKTYDFGSADSSYSSGLYGNKSYDNSWKTKGSSSDYTSSKYNSYLSQDYTNKYPSIHNAKNDNKGDIKNITQNDSTISDLRDHLSQDHSSDYSSREDETRDKRSDAKKTTEVFDLSNSFPSKDERYSTEDDATSNSKPGHSHSGQDYSTSKYDSFKQHTTSHSKGEAGENVTKTFDSDRNENYSTRNYLNQDHSSKDSSREDEMRDTKVDPKKTTKVFDLSNSFPSKDESYSSKYSTEDDATSYRKPYSPNASNHYLDVNSNISNVDETAQAKQEYSDPGEKLGEILDDSTFVEEKDPATRYQTEDSTSYAPKRKVFDFEDAAAVKEETSERALFAAEDEMPSDGYSDTQAYKYRKDLELHKPRTTATNRFDSSDDGLFDKPKEYTETKTVGKERNEIKDHRKDGWELHKSRTTATSRFDSSDDGLFDKPREYQETTTVGTVRNEMKDHRKDWELYKPRTTATSRFDSSDDGLFDKPKEYLETTTNDTVRNEMKDHREDWELHKPRTTATSRFDSSDDELFDKSKEFPETPKEDTVRKERKDYTQTKPSKIVASTPKSKKNQVRRSYDTDPVPKPSVGISKFISVVPEENRYLTSVKYIPDRIELRLCGTTPKEKKVKKWRSIPDLYNITLRPQQSNDEPIQCEQQNMAYAYDSSSEILNFCNHKHEHTKEMYVTQYTHHFDSDEPQSHIAGWKVDVEPNGIPHEKSRMCVLKHPVVSGSRRRVPRPKSAPPQLFRPPSPGETSIRSQRVDVVDRGNYTLPRPARRTEYVYHSSIPDDSANEDVSSMGYAPSEDTSDSSAFVSDRFHNHDDPTNFLFSKPRLIRLSADYPGIRNLEKMRQKRQSMGSASSTGSRSSPGPTPSPMDGGSYGFFVALTSGNSPTPRSRGRFFSQN